ncbi:MAG: ribonuclease T [Hyphomicrobiaceae bacterium]|nr:ribonuclease T [Hyphomicrobiaceae bacterium]
MHVTRLPTAILAAVACFLPLLTSSADAQRRYDDRGYGYDRGYDNRGPRQQRNVAGVFDYYALVLSWSPTHCASEDGKRDEMQCNRRDGRRYNFVLHGLWPQYERGFPNDCPTRDRPFVPQRVIDSILDVMPARGLVIHEYRKHGTCSGLDPAGYFDLARQLYNRIRIPERYVNPFDVQFVAPEELMREMIAANPELKPDMMAISCGGPGNRLKEVRVCFTKSGQLRSCGQNEDQRRMCSARQMYVPPVRSSAKGTRGNGRPATEDRDSGHGGNGQDGRRDDRGTHPAPSRDYLPGPRI